MPAVLLTEPNRTHCFYAWQQVLL